MASVGIVERLQHLVSFGHNCVVVEAFDLAKSASIASDFIASQTEDTNIVIVKAKKDDLANKREFLHQISGGQIAPTTDPLRNQARHLINSEQLPSLMIILQGDNATSQFYRELSQFFAQTTSEVSAKNLIVFCSKTETTRITALMEQNLKQCIVMQEQSSVSTFSSSSEGTLDELIAENRKLLADRIAKRNKPSNTGSKSISVLRSPSVLLASIGLFFSVFLGLLWWIYQPLEQRPWSSNKVTETPPAAMSSAQNLEQSTTEIVIDNTPLSTVSPASSQQLDTHERSQPRVLDWHTATEKPAMVTATSGDTKATFSKQNTHDGDLELENPDQQLPQDVDVATTISRADDLVASQAELARQYTQQIDQHRSELSRLPDNGFVIQLAAMTDPQVLQKFIQSNALSGKVWQYSATRDGGVWHVVLVNRVYQSAQNAREDITANTRKTFASKPFIKPVTQVKQELK